jgi:hypothetical protein
MIHFPTPPDTLVTRQIECVSCKEVFIISEDYAQASSERSDHWRMPSEEPSHTELRHHSEPTYQTVLPFARTTPNQDPSPILTWSRSQRAFINCPRCGTDNRNWLRLAYAPHPGNWRERILSRLSRFWLIWLSYAVTIFLLVRLLLRESIKNNLIAYGLLLVIMILGTLIPASAIPGQWRRVRIHKIVNKFDKTQPLFNRISPSLKQGVFYFVLFVLALPFVSYILLPRTTNTFIKEKPLVERIDQALVELNPGNIETLLAEDGNALAPTENALTGMQSLMHKNLFLCNPTAIDSVLMNLRNLNSQGLSQETTVQIDNAIYNLNKLQTEIQNGTCDPNHVANAIIPLSAIYAEEWQKCAPLSASERAQNPDCNKPIIESMVQYVQNVGDPGAPLFLGTLADEIRLTLQEARFLVQETNDPVVLDRIESEVAIVEKAIDRANNGSNATPGTSTMLNTWLKYVGLSCLVAVITAVFATEIYISHINHHLPKPICESIPNMTRVVQWEIGRSLETLEELRDVEWMGARRNKHGGINLEGLRRAPNETAEGNYVRAQKYLVVSDMWGTLMETANLCTQKDKTRFLQLLPFRTKLFRDYLKVVLDNFIAFYH